MPNKLNKNPINFRYNDRTVTADTTLTEDDDLVRGDASSGAITLTLPPVDADIVAGQRITVKKIDSSTNTVTLDGDGSETIDGQTTVIITDQWAGLIVQSNGTTWDIVGVFG